MTQKEIELLNFKKVVIGNDQENDTEIFYYTHAVTKGLSFVTPCNDELKDPEDWYVEFFNTDIAVRFHKFEEMQVLLNTLERAVVKSNNNHTMKKLSLINYEGDCLRAEKVNESISIIDQYGKTVDKFNLVSFRDFIEGRLNVVDSAGRVWKFPLESVDSRPSPEKILKFLEP